MQDETFLRQKAYQIIQRKLLDGDLRAGNLVSELALAQEIGMSRTPVREAIGQLQREGLFYKVPRVGTIVRLPDRKELGELYDVREALESYAAVSAVAALTDEELAEMARVQRELEEINAELRSRDGLINKTLLRRFFMVDIGFHQGLINAAQNLHLSKIIAEFRVIQRVFEYDHMIHGQGIIERATVQHGEILAALQSRDTEAARVAMAGHIRSSRDYALINFDVEPQDTEPQTAPTE